MGSYKKGDVFSVKVQRVVDGDTVRVQKKGLKRFVFGAEDIVVRLYGMDAPESEQRHGKASAKALSKMLKKNGLIMEVMGEDRYDRTVGLLYYGSPGREKSVNWKMVVDGWAHAYTNYGGRELGMKEAETGARAAKKGIWKGRGKNEVPGDWRRHQREKGSRVIKLRMVFVFVAILVMLAAGLWVWTR